MKERKSMRGVSVDLGKLMSQQERSIAVGNTRSNARGDQLGRAGRVVKSADEISREHYNRNNPNAVKKTSLKADDIKLDMDEKLNEAREAAKAATEDDWSEPVDTPTPNDDSSTEAVEEAVDIVQAAEAKAAEESSETEEDEWVEDDEGNFVRKSELEEAKNEPVSKSKKSRKK